MTDATDTEEEPVEEPKPAKKSDRDSADDFTTPKENQGAAPA